MSLLAVIIFLTVACVGEAGALSNGQQIATGAQITNVVGDSGDSEQSDITNGLVGWWKFSEGSGTTVTDSSGSGNDGTLVNSPTWSTGPNGLGAIHLVRASSQYVNCGQGETLDITGPFSMTFWSRFNTIPTGIDDSGGYALLSKNESGGYGVIVNNSATKRIETFNFINGAYDNAGEPISNISASVWYFFAVTFSGTQTKYFRDAVLRDTVSRAGTMNSVPFPFLIGANPQNAGAVTQVFDGWMADVRIYGRCLTDTEIATLYANGAK